MQEESEENHQSKQDIFEEYPFLISFPFTDYQPHLEKGEDYAVSSGIDPIVISAGGGIAQPKFVNFNHTGKYTKIMLSFYTYDIQYIYDNSHKIKKLDSIREILDKGLNTNDLIDKITAIKSGERFIKKIGKSMVAGKVFDTVFDDFMVSKGYKLDKVNTRKIKSMYKTINEDELEEGVKDVARSFYNIHLHHIKILLGIVIASKIH